MANSNEAPPKSSPNEKKKSQSDNFSQKELPHPVVRNTKLPFNYLTLLTLLLATIALIIAISTAYFNYQSRQHSLQQSQQLKTTLRSLKEQQLEIKNHVDATTETVNQSQLELQNRVQTLNKNLQTAVKQHLYQKQDWLLLKARYYLELAQINIHWSHDQEETIALLQQADALLMTLSDQRLFAIRQAIAREIAQLQAQPKIDITGLLSQLDAVNNAVSNLTIKKPFDTTQTTMDGEKNPSWKAKLQSTINVFEKLVVVRRHDEDIQPLISPLHQTLLRDSIRLNIQEAQWAILQHNPQVYQLVLTRALQEIKHTFAENDAKTQAVIKQLQTLLQEKLITVKPVIEESLSLLNQLIDSQNAQNTDKSLNQDGDKTL